MMINESQLRKELREIVEAHNKPAKLERLAAEADSDNRGDVYSAGLDDGEYSLAKRLLYEHFGEAP